MTELVPDNRQKVRFSNVFRIACAPPRLQPQDVGCLVRCCASVRASDDYGDQPRIVRRATVDRSASMAARQKNPTATLRLLHRRK
jgi:hypothetical protein